MSDDLMQKHKIRQGSEKIRKGLFKNAVRVCRQFFQILGGMENISFL